MEIPFSFFFLRLRKFFGWGTHNNSCMCIADYSPVESMCEFLYSPDWTPQSHALSIFFFHSVWQQVQRYAFTHVVKLRTREEIQSWIGICNWKFDESFFFSKMERESQKIFWILFYCVHKTTNVRLERKLEFSIVLAYTPCFFLFVHYQYVDPSSSIQGFKIKETNLFF